ncbi:MAG TPA: AsnC family transcriptional regulator [Acidobacteriota bacterium]|nr:AsnC family transcriptional regulator [Acidobacteriota bacterium]
MTEKENSIKLDKRDKRLIHILGENSRMPLTEIGKHLRLHPDTARYKLQRLFELGVVCKNTAELDFIRLGYSIYQVFMLVDTDTEEEYTNFITMLSQHPNTKEVRTYHDRWDVEWVVVARNLQEFDEFFWEFTAKSKARILHKNHLSVVEYLRTTNVAHSLFPNETVKIEQQKSSQSLSLDSTDRALLQVLAKDARTAATSIAAEIGVSVDSVIRRIKKLYSDGVITKFSIVLDRAKIGHDWYVFAVRCNSLAKNIQSSLREFVRTHPHIFRCVKVHGSWDFLFYISTDSREEFHKTIREIKTILSAHLTDYDTWIIYDEIQQQHIPKTITD